MTTELAELFAALNQLLELYPRFRLGQLVVALAEKVKGFERGAVYDVEDDELLESARAMIAFHEKHEEDAAECRRLFAELEPHPCLSHTGENTSSL